MIRPPLRAVLALVVALVSLGCGESVRVMVRSGTTIDEQQVRGAAADVARRAELEMECPLEELVLQEANRGTYLVEGCGARLTYVCRRGTCAMDHREAAPRVAAAASWSDAHASAIATRMTSILTRCGVTPTEGFAARFWLSRTGRVVRRDRAAYSPLVGTCIDRELATVGLRGIVPEGREVVLQVTGGVLRATTAAPVVASEPSPPPAPPGAP